MSVLRPECPVRCGARSSRCDAQPRRYAARRTVGYASAARSSGAPSRFASGRLAEHTTPPEH
jgi:hypothetical protein